MITLKRVVLVLGFLALILIGYNLALGQGRNFPSSAVTYYGTAVACANTAQAAMIVYGTAPLTSGTPSTATLTGLPFSSSTSYSCVGTEQTTAANDNIKFANASASSTVISGPNTLTDVIAYVCIGT